MRSVRGIYSVQEMIDRFLNFYQPSTPHWSNISEVVTQMDWEDVVASTMSEYLDLQGVDRRWTRELVEAATRVNYGQVSDSNSIQGIDVSCLAHLFRMSTKSTRLKACAHWQHRVQPA